MNGNGLSLVKWMARHAGTERGQALVELALTVPLLMLILLGSAELARLAYAAIEIANAAEAGAQFATENPSTMNDAAGITLAAQNDATNLTGVTASPISWVTTCSDGSAYSASDNSCASGAALTAVTVKASVNFDPLIHLPLFPTTFTLNAYATEKCRSY